MGRDSSSGKRDQAERGHASTVDTAIEQGLREKAERREAVLKLFEKVKSLFTPQK